MNGVEEWCRTHLAGAGVEVRSGGTDGVTVLLPNELYNANRIMFELCDEFDVDIDAISGELGTEWKIVRSTRAQRDPHMGPVHAPSGCCTRMATHLAWFFVCVCIIVAWLVSVRVATAPFKASGDL